ncbi:TonB-dependent receptor [Kineobactrum salinum]|uniref:TonB-dependent receptor n=1 Tax=Kineobactrum salinum TaxID=2708301 RepID=A0A6C0U6P5_9GAMM|nr:TonB-dependent receptor [Kineobactrum salinum]QIB67019.1 TonB-dependent receptor [Kineobactrum salinum]
MKAREDVIRGAFNLRLTPVALALPALLATGSGVWAQDGAATGNRRVLEEIIVSAQKRSQNINDVGIAITAFDSGQVRDLAFMQPQDIATQTTNFSVNTLATNVPNFTIRGVGVNDYAINQATSVGTYVDQVFISSPAMMLFQMFDTQRVEVLKGPQGTLYGRNTTGGAVLYFSNRPTEEFSGEAYVEGGNAGYYLLEAAVSGPLSDTLSARMAVNTTQSDGLQDNIITGETHGGMDRTAWRGLLQWQPRSDLDLMFNVHGGEDNSDLNSFTVPGTGSNDSSTGTIDTLDGVPYRDNESLGVSLTVNWDIGPVTFTSISSYDELDRFEYGDSDGQLRDGRIDQILISDIEQVTQELRLANAGGGDVNWVAGVYYGKDEIDDSTVYEVTGAGFPPAAFGLPAPYALIDTLGNAYQQISETYAAFGQVEWAFTDRWSLTLGLRYTQEDKELQDVTTPWSAEPGSGESGPVVSGLLFPPADYEEDFDAFSGKVALDYRLNDDTLLYASISEGYKSGGFQGTLVFTPAAIIPFDEETVLSYEVGAKLTLLEGRMQINSAAFFYDYENLQAQGTIEGGAAGVENLFALQNIGDAEVLGFEVDVQATPLPRLELALGVGYLDAKITDPFVPEVEEDGRPAVSPEWNLNGRVRYDVITAQDYTLYLQGNFNWQDEQYFDIYETPFLLENAYGVVNASLGVDAVDGTWKATVWGRNLADENYRAGGFTGGVAGDVQIYGQPRTYGVSFNYRF